MEEEDQYQHNIISDPSSWHIDHYSGKLHDRFLADIHGEHDYNGDSDDGVEDIDDDKTMEVTKKEIEKKKAQLRKEEAEMKKIEEDHDKHAEKRQSLVHDIFSQALKIFKGSTAKIEEPK